MDREPVVLYVEDDVNSRKLMEMLLKRRMKLKHVTILEDSQNFISNMQALDPKPNLILLDIHMLPHNGFEMLAMLREMSWVGDTPIVALTASVMNEEVQRLRNAGFDGCISKPLEIEDFPDTIARILEGERVWRITS
ncbi:MAG: response regulator [Anaerolineae bacterium]|nr:response regulator [Anaerolineae bacterium]